MLIFTRASISIYFYETLCQTSNHTNIHVWWYIFSLNGGHLYCEAIGLNRCCHYSKQKQNRCITQKWLCVIVVIDNGQIASQVKQLFPSHNGVNCILELIGTVTLLDSIQAAAPKGTRSISCETVPDEPLVKRSYEVSK
jgi:hypothetical protein